MSRTNALLSATFCTGLDALVYAYYARVESWPYCSGECGDWETCERLTDAEDLLDALSGACSRGWFDLVVMLIANGATHAPSTMRAACEFGDMRIIAFLIANESNYWDYGLSGAVWENRREVAELMIACGASVDEALYEACYCGHIEMIDLLAAHGAINWNDGLLGACENRQDDVARLMVARGAIIDDPEWNAWLAEKLNMPPNS